jgi:hypothetical protein
MGYSDLNTQRSIPTISSGARWGPSAQPARSSSRYKWISGPVTTVRNELMSLKGLAVARVGLTAWEWFTESSWSGIVVLGNHPCSVRHAPSLFNRMRSSSKQQE